MRKIKYPFHTEAEKEIFLKKYFEEISPQIPNQTEICKEIKKIGSTWDLKKLLTADFSELIEFSQKNNAEKLSVYFKTGADKKGYLYSNIQRKIADFFVSQKININTCFYCNIEYINSFHEEYSGVEELINFAHWKQLKNIVGKGIASKITKSRITKTISRLDAEKIMSKDQFDSLLEINKIFNEHYTLDHILPKSKYPFLSISLFNLVPCCYSCNSKFKHEKEFNINENLPKIIPSSSEYNFDELAQFKLKFKENENKEKLDLKVELTNLSNIKNVEEYITMFKLKGRYQYHQKKAEDLIDKRQKYSDSQIKEIARLTKQSIENLKKDIFGKECFESNNEPFEKYKQDIAIQLGLI